MSNIIIDWLEGNCPVQAEGRICGNSFYFRARGNRWYVEVYEHNDNNIISNPVPNVWKYEESYGTTPFEAGWMTEKEAEGFIIKAITLYLERK